MVFHSKSSSCDDDSGRFQFASNFRIPNQLILILQVRRTMMVDNTKIESSEKKLAGVTRLRGFGEVLRRGKLKV